METETPSARRPASWLLIVLGLVVVAFVGYRMWPDESAAMPPPAQTSARAQGGTGSVAREDLKVNLEALTAKRGDPGDVERNPFRFRPPPAPPPQAYKPPPQPQNLPPALPPPPVIPPIPLKFMGTVEGPGIKLAALTDCKGFTYSGREGETIDGQYKLVRIQLESIVMEYVNGTGRTTITKSGECPRR
jgi:hypothetical protein